MKNTQGSIMQPGALGTNRHSKQIDRRPPAAVLTLVRNRSDSAARKSRADGLSRIEPGARLRRPPLTETFTGAVEAARAQARQIINEPVATGYVRIVEGWQQLADGRIQFTIRRLSRPE
jgi:hypothetical protein